MVWYRKPGLNRFRGRQVLEAFYLAPQPEAAPINPPDEEEDWFLASFTLTPIYETGSSTDDVFVGAVYIDSNVDLVAKAYLGSTKSGTAVTVKVSTTYATPGSSATGALNLTTSSGLGNVNQTETSALSVSAGSYLFFYISCASAECSWQCPAIVLVRQ